ncbi:MAG: OmpA family protein [Rhizobiaceae bacterium]
MIEVDIVRWWDTFEPLFHKMGPLDNMVLHFGYIITAAIAVLGVFGVLTFAPPIEKSERKLLNKSLVAITAMILGGLYYSNTPVVDGPNLIILATPTALLAVVSFISYIFLRNTRTMVCGDGDPKRYLIGAKLLPEAKKVLDGNFHNLSDERQIKVGQPPENAKQYFQLSGKDPKYIWTADSLRQSFRLMVISYVLCVLSTVSTLGSIVIELQEAEILREESGNSVTVRVPARLLFDFDSAEIHQNSKKWVTKLAFQIEQSGAKYVRVVGHTDGIGDPEYNLRLSNQRALAVKSCLVEFGRLSNVSFEIIGLGSREPIYAEQDQFGEDRPEARQSNRRVEITYSPDK